MTEVNDNILVNTSQVQNLTNMISNAEKAVAQSEALARLMNNRDFQEIILESFLKDEAVRGVQLSVDMKVSPEHREAALALAQATGYLKQFLSVVSQKGELAKGKLEEYRDTLAEVRQEEMHEEGGY